MSNQALRIAETMIPTLTEKIIDEDLNLISETNAFCWELEDFSNLKAQFSGFEKINFSVDLNLSGDQDTDRPFCGTEIRICLQGQISRISRRDSWKVKDYKFIKEPMISDF
jgi:hypothetical protein